MEAVEEVVAVAAAVAADEGAEAREVEVALGAEVVPREVAIARQPEAEAAPGPVPDLGEAALGQVEARDPVEAAEVAAARVPVALAPGAAADIGAELPAALEAAEAWAAAIDRQRSHLAATSRGTGRVDLVGAIDRESETGPVASVGRVVSEIGPAALADQVALQIVRVALVDDREASAIDPAALVALAELEIVRAAPEELQIGPVVSVAQAVSAIDPELGIDLVPEEGLALGPVSARDSRIDRELATAHSSAIALGTVATDSATEAISRTTGAIALKIAVIVLKTVRRIAATDSTTVVIGWRTAGTGSKIEVIASRTVEIG